MKIIMKILMLIIGKVVYWPLYLHYIILCRYFGTSLESVIEDNLRYNTELIKVGNKRIVRLTDKWGRHKFVFFNDEDLASNIFHVYYGLLLSHNEFSGQVESELVAYHKHLGIVRYTGKNKPCFLDSLDRLEALF